MSAKTLPEIEEPVTIDADDFHALEQKIIRTIEMLKTEREARAAAERELRRVREQIDGRHDELDSLRREVVGLKREREEVKSRVEKMLKQIDAMTEVAAR